MSKWVVFGKLYSPEKIQFSETMFVFEVKDKPDYSHNQMRSIAKVVAVEAEQEFNQNNTPMSCKVDLRSVQLAADDVPVNYTAKSDYSEISICTK